MREMAKTFKALSDETRLKMLALLERRGELCVCDFVAALNITQSKASRHLQYLVHSGLLADRREGVWVYYRLRTDTEAAEVLKPISPLLSSLDLSDVERRLDEWKKRPCLGTKHLNGGC